VAELRFSALPECRDIERNTYELADRRNFTSQCPLPAFFSPDLPFRSRPGPAKDGLTALRPSRSPLEFFTLPKNRRLQRCADQEF
jgi:hypothetical protein